MTYSRLFLQPPAAGRLRVSHRHRPEPADPWVGIPLVWSERAIASTGRGAFRLTVPIDGPLPGQVTVERVLQVLRSLGDGVPPSRDGCRIVAVDGSAMPMRGLRSCLVIEVRCAGSCGIVNRDAAQIAGLIRNAARPGR